MTRHAARRWWTAALVVAAMGLLISGCGGSSPTALQHRLLSVADLPAGWVAAPSSASKDVKLTSGPCLLGLAAHPKGVTYVTRGFVEGKLIPSLGEVLVKGPRVHQAWQHLERALTLCRSATIRLGTARVKASIRPLAVAGLAGASSAYAFAFTFSGIRIGFDLVVFEVGQYGGYVTYSDLGAPQLATVKAFLDAAIAKATRGSTARIAENDSVVSAAVHTAHTALGAVAYRVVGAGPPLVLITGYGGTMEDWDWRLVDALAEHHRVVVFDNAGIGRTEALPAPLTIDAMANQASALIDTLRLGRPSVLGWSMGSMVAQALAVLHPTQARRLILAASYPGNGTTIRPAETAIAALKSSKWQHLLFPADQTVAQNTYLTALTSYPATQPAALTTVTGQNQAIDRWWSGQDPAGRRANTIAIPTLIADGAQDELDPIANSHTLANLIPGAKLKLYPDAGHAFLFQDRGSFIRLIESFLR